MLDQKFINNLNDYTQAVQRYINQCMYIDMNCIQELSSLDIVRNIKPLFEFKGVKTWIIRGKGGFQIIWRTDSDWNVAWLADNRKTINFREHPQFL